MVPIYRLTSFRRARSSSKVTYHFSFTERGNFLALDLGGTNFRVLLITLAENHFDMKSKIYAIAEKIMLGPGTQVRTHLNLLISAELCLASVASESI